MPSKTAIESAPIATNGSATTRKGVDDRAISEIRNPEEPCTSIDVPTALLDQARERQRELNDQTPVKWLTAEMFEAYLEDTGHADVTPLKSSLAMAREHRNK